MGNTKKILFISFLSIVEGNGISNKIKAQVQAFKHNGCECYLMHYQVENGVYYICVDGKRLFRLGAFSRFFNKSRMYDAILNFIFSIKIDIIYFRYNMAASASLINFYKKLNGKCVRLLEIPTYPYDSEFKNAGIKLRIINILEKLYRNKFSKCFDKIITFVDEEKIFGVPTIKIANAVDPNTIRIAETKINDGAINLIAVANIHFWHGFDRIIEGLNIYYKDKTRGKNVYLTIVGDGNQEVKNQLISLVEKYGLNKYVTFKGNTSGDELDNLFDDANLAIGCLACHRKNITKVKSLKNVEYAMRGLPFIYSEVNDDFDDKPYVLKVSPDETPLNINNIVSFMSSISLKPELIRASVSDLTWDAQMRTILNGI